ncbi:hypothetical protein UFOVP122_33 [uncultured Caudovirales phage]|uniref:Uncharacterized protein n=1 Tax=uncultured Caudovirales phage TaxID=2100421 RepID=A0A6J5L8N3_9CAUD|nr:hypothetical protein UFOVP122_33 [uncultured Caudovirales phage]
MNSTEKAEMQEEEKLIPVETREDADDHDDQDDNGAEDERLSDSRNEEEDEKRESRRNERKRRRESQRFARDKTKEELQWLMDQNKTLQQRLEAVEGHALAAQKGSLDQNYDHALNSVRATEAALAKAIELGDGGKVPELLRQRDQAMARAAEINRVKSQMNAPAPVQNREVRERAEKWAEKNRWFSANGNDPDSAAAKAIDAGLISEGFDPSSKRYWKELDRRISERLPHRFADSDNSDYTPNQQTGRRGPPVSGSREISSPGSRKVYLSPERVQAMKDAGYWDDPVLRQRMLKRYQETDRDLKSAR